MNRREFITLLGGAAAAWPLAARAQQTAKLPTIGLMVPSTPLVESQRVAAFVQRLRELGWIEGRTVAIEVRWAEGRNERVVFTFKDGRTLVASTSVSAASLRLYPPGRIRSIYREPIALEANRNVSPIAATRQPSPA